MIFHGQDPDFSIRDMYNAVASGDFPKYTMYIQVRLLIQTLSLTLTSVGYPNCAYRIRSKTIS